jgi:hypothetical protein
MTSVNFYALPLILSTSKSVNSLVGKSNAGGRLLKRSKETACGYIFRLTILPREAVPRAEDAREILGPRERNMPSYSTITSWKRALQRGEDIQSDASGGGHFPDERIRALIAEALEEAPFHSVRSLASTTKIPATTGWRHLHSAGHVVRNLRIVPDTVSPAQKVARGGSAINLTNILLSAVIAVGATF